MAVVSLKSNIWTNNDGLAVPMGPSEATVTRVGEYNNESGEHWTEADIDLSVLTTGNQTILSDTVTIPNGAFVYRVSVTVTKEPTDASGTANLDLGLIDQDRSTEIDFNGFLAAADAWNSGTDLGRTTTYELGTTEAGALVGTKITNTGLLVANAETAVFTAGVIKVRIFWFVPLAADL